MVVGVEQHVKGGDRFNSEEPHGRVLVGYSDSRLDAEEKLAEETHLFLANLVKSRETVECLGEERMGGGGVEEGLT